MKNGVISLGLDLSLVSSGIVVLENDKIVCTKNIKSKPVGDRPTDELKRIRKIVQQIEDVVSEFNPAISVIENLAFATRASSSLTQLAGLSFLTRAMLQDYNIPFFLCAPTTLKKFATGKGNSEKDHIILEAFKQYGVDGIDNNVADAIFLSKIGSAIIGVSKVTVSYQVETIELLKKQHE